LHLKHACCFLHTVLIAVLYPAVQAGGAAGSDRRWAERQRQLREGGPSSSYDGYDGADFVEPSDSDDTHAYEDLSEQDSSDQEQPWQGNGTSENGHAAGNGSSGDSGSMTAYSDAEDASLQYGGAAA
jgi:heme-degrading monooxygenase HmoA